MATGQGIGDSAPDPVSRSTGVRTGRKGKRYDPAWSKASEAEWSGWEAPEKAAFRRAWVGRGFRRPPSAEQWALLDDVNRAEPERLARFVAEAPNDLQSNEVIRVVLGHLNEDPLLRRLVTTGKEEARRRRSEREVAEPTRSHAPAATDGRDPLDATGP